MAQLVASLYFMLSGQYGFALPPLKAQKCTKYSTDKATIIKEITFKYITSSLLRNVTASRSLEEL